MKILVIGNTNNYPFRLVRAMRQIGAEAELVIYESQMLHRPEGEDPSLRSGFPSWIHDFSHLDESDLVSPSTRLGGLLSLLEQSDALVLNGLGPSLREFVERPSIAWLTGSDLDYYANYTTVAARERTWGSAFKKSASARFERGLWARFIGRQREGILRSVATSYFYRGINQEADALLDGIGVSDGSRFFIYMANDTGDAHRPPDRNPIPRLLCGARLTWKPPVPPGGSLLDFKGSDVMIRGVGRYLNRNSNAKFELRLPRKGLHVAESEALVRECGLTEYVVWLDEMPLHEFMNEVRAADVIFDQLGMGMVGMAGIDSLAIGRPVIANGRPDIWVKATGRPLPVCQATSDEDVCMWLELLLSDKKAWLRKAREGSQYAKASLSAKANAIDLIERIERVIGSNGGSAMIDRRLSS